jgi:hypothetical protein
MGSRKGSLSFQMAYLMSESLLEEPLLSAFTPIYYVR